jgi:hypothetical protein
MEILKRLGVAEGLREVGESAELVTCSVFDC